WPSTTAICTSCSGTARSFHCRKRTPRAAMRGGPRTCSGPARRWPTTAASSGRGGHLMKKPKPPAAAGAADAAPPAASGPLCVLVPTSVYDLAGAQASLGLNKSTLKREYREGRLRVGKRAGRCYFLGEWLIQWLREGELPRRRRAEANGEH